MPGSGPRHWSLSSYACAANTWSITSTYGRSPGSPQGLVSSQPHELPAVYLARYLSALHMPPVEVSPSVGEPTNIRDAPSVQPLWEKGRRC